MYKVKVPHSYKTERYMKKSFERIHWLCHLLNLAACSLKFKRDHHAAQKCTKTLQIELENVKAFYHRGLPLIIMSNFDQAREDLIEARSLEPSNRAIENQLRSPATKVQAQKKKYKDKLKAMLGGKTNFGAICHVCPIE